MKELIDLVKKEGKKIKLSCGIIVYRWKEDTVYYLLLRNGRKWGFAKGGKEKGESDLQTAKRETIEETGLKNVKVDTGFSKVIFYYLKWNFKKNKPRKKPKKKFVKFYVGESPKGKVQISDEHDEYKWVTKKGALKYLDFNHDMVNEAHSYITKKRDQEF